MTAGLPVCVVDAFADKPFTGNPAGVVFLDESRDDAWRQSVAAELNLSETAFVESEGGAFRLRWFTPTVEVPLCGHATLAAAHALWESGRLPPAAEARFETKSGALSARRDGDWIVLDLPALPARPAKPPPGLLAALADTPLAFLENDGVYLLEMDSEETVRRAVPNLAAWSALTSKGLILTAAARRASHDFVSRCFFPAEGIPEDPVTGSAHCALGPYWAERLGKPVLTAFQASRRGGFLLVRPKGARVEVGGRAVTAWRGSLA
ncbi:MAG: PhzF family phenazine biosynthesis protein [Elusimicrobia bacterium]|nr:PhzF family phenazine biosynthesis protein [Elusimicrobiota bacterium]